MIFRFEAFLQFLNAICNEMDASAEGTALIYLTPTKATGSGAVISGTDGALIHRRRADSRRQQRHADL